jgi:glucan biosynthesis protein C
MSTKSPSLFLKGKLIRIGGPTLAYTLLGYPAGESALHLILHGDWPIARILHIHWTQLRGIQGPVWYGALLLIFDSCYILIQKYTTPRPACQTSGTVPAEAIAGAICACSILSFLIRLEYPTTYVFAPLNLRLGYLPQYVSAYAVGTQIDRPDLINLLPGGLARTLGAVTIGALAANVAVVSLATTWTVENFSGGLNPVALCYAIWNETLGYLIFATSYNLFRRSLNHPWLVSRYSYAAFLVHPSISIAVEAAVDHWRANALLQTAVVGTLNVGTSFVAAWCVLQIPGMGKIL